MSGGGRCPRRRWWSHRRWSRRRHVGGAKICDDDDGVECVVKLVDVGTQTDATPSICVRDPRIGRGRLRVNAEGILYVLDSEDEDSDMEVDADAVGVATEGAATVNGVDLSVEGPPVASDGAANADLSLGPPVAGAGAAGEDLPLGPPLGHPVAVAGAAGEELHLGPPLVAPSDASGMDLAPEVAARLKEVLANMDPVYHEVFINMYKILIFKALERAKIMVGSRKKHAIRGVEELTKEFLLLDRSEVAKFRSNSCGPSKLRHAVCGCSSSTPITATRCKQEKKITFMMFLFSFRIINIEIYDMHAKHFIVTKM